MFTTAKEALEVLLTIGKATCKVQNKAIAAEKAGDKASHEALKATFAVLRDEAHALEAYLIDEQYID